MPPYRIGVLGGATLLGKELGDLIGERRFPALPPRLFNLPAPSKINGAETPQAGVIGSLMQYGDEAAVQEQLSPASVRDLDALFLTGTETEARAAWAVARDAVPVVLDCTGTLRDEPEAVVAGFHPELPSGTRLVAVAHPAAQALALLLDRLQQVGGIEASAATIFEPASQRGWPGIQELEQQTVKVLGMQPLPLQVFGAQVAFNLRAAPAGVEAAVRADLARLGAPPTAIRVLQAPVFHASVLSLWVRFRAAAPAPAVRAALSSEALAWPEAGQTADVLAAAGMDAVLVGEPAADPAGGIWLFASLDNLHRSAAAALEAAEAALLARRPA